MPFIKSPQCRICQSGLRHQIDKMISDPAIPTREIVAFANEKRLTINKVNICRHKKNHMLPNKSKLIDDLQSKEVNAKLTTEMVSNVEFLELIKNTVHKGIQSGELIPSISEGLKAAELILKANDGDPLTKGILDFVQGISLKAKSS